MAPGTTYLVSEVTIGPLGITSRQWEAPGPIEPGPDWVEMPQPDSPLVLPGFPGGGKRKNAR
jgi:hypothetical protein